MSRTTRRWRSSRGILIWARGMRLYLFNSSMWTPKSAAAGALGRSCLTWRARKAVARQRPGGGRRAPFCDAPTPPLTDGSYLTPRLSFGAEGSGLAFHAAHVIVELAGAVGRGPLRDLHD